MEMLSLTEGLLLILITLLIYFLPVIVVMMRKQHHAFSGILIVNLLLGWTGIVWLICLIWAFIAREENQKIVIVQQTNPNEVISSINNADEIRKYAELKEQGIITEEEFLAKKHQLLNYFPPQNT